QQNAAGECGEVDASLRTQAHRSSAPVKPLRLRLIERPAARMTIIEAKNRNTPMAEPRAQVPVSELQRQAHAEGGRLRTAEEALGYRGGEAGNEDENQADHGADPVQRPGDLDESPPGVRAID